MLTTIKSIVFHHRNIRFYLINDDFSQEWFRGLNRHLAAFGSEVINCRVDSSHIKQFKTNSNYASYLRYFVADFVSEERALYLDSDTVSYTHLKNKSLAKFGTILLYLIN